MTVRDVANDFNGDGRSDVLWRDASGTIVEWLAQPDGRLVQNPDATNFLPTTWNIVGTGDYNGDGNDDLLWRHNSGRVIEWLGQDNGSFVLNSLVGYEVATDWRIVGTGDFNGDHRDDIIWRRDDGTATIWLGQTDGTFVSNDAVATYSVSNAWHVTATGDFNGDGRSDVLWRNDDGTLTEWLGQANGSLLANAAATYSVNSAYHVVSTGDFNGDGRDDILWRNDDGTLTDWLAQPNGTFVNNDAVATYLVSNEWQVEQTGDFNRDGLDDILWRRADGTVTEWLGRTNGSFFTTTAIPTYTVSAPWHIIETGDFNGDGRNDVLWRNDNGTVTDWLGQSDGTFFSNDAALYPVGAAWSAVGTGDFNGDNRDDVLWRNTDGTITEWLGQMDGTFLSNDANATYNVSNSLHVAGIGDFNGDNREDILWRNDNGTVTEWLGQANGSFTPNPNAVYAVSNAWQIAATGDFNGDNRNDVLWRNVDGTVTEWLAQDNGGFVSNDAVATYSIGTSWHVAGSGDFNGDNLDDILWRNDDGTVTEWLALGNGSFVSNDSLATYGVSNAWHISGIGDVNGDGRDDILWRNDDGTVTNWYGQDNGSFFINAASYQMLSGWHVQPVDDLV